MYVEQVIAFELLLQKTRHDHPSLVTTRKVTGSQGLITLWQRSIQMEGVTMVEDPQIMELTASVLLHCHTSTPMILMRSYDTCPELAAGGDRLSFVLGHQEINGAVVQPGRESTCHAHWPNNWPPLISGHIHERHHIRNVLYVGTPMQHSSK